MPKRGTGRPLALAVTALLLAAAAPSLVGSGAASDPSPLSTEVDLLIDTFEGAGLGSNWTVSDVNATGGTDYWARSTYRAATGNGSAWAAGWGNRTSNATTTVFTDGFEGNVSANWTTEDRDPNSGNDTWGVSSARAHTGSYSYWSAAVGFNDDDGTDTNANLSLYDTYMDTVAWRDITTPPGQSSIVSFWYWIDAEIQYDFFFLLLNVSGTWMPAQILNGHAGTTVGWVQATLVAPSGTSQIVFEFLTDSSVDYEGVYIDDIVVTSFESTTVFTEGFESAMAPTWTASDGDSTNGRDYWNRSSARSLGGSWSAWCAQEGFNDETQADDNRNLSLYDSGMDAIMWRSVDLSNFTGAIMTYHVWLDSELGYDYLYAAYFVGNQWVLSNQAEGPLGPSYGWAILSAAIPAGATRVGFVFQSDDSIVAEGAYVDDVTLLGVPRVDLNSDTHVYDTGMNATMVASINMGVFSTAQLDYSYWVDTDASQDQLLVVYRTAGVWFETDGHSGSSGGWQTSSVAIPPGTDRVGFRFVSTMAGTREGAYVDNVRVFSTIQDLLCDATADGFAGVEGQTVVNFTGAGYGGIPSYTFEWDFGDGSNSSAQNPTHNFATAGFYVVNLTVRDNYGQVCYPVPMPVLVVHDLSTIDVQAPAPQLLEGASEHLTARDAAGHALDFNWTVQPAACGLLSNATGPATDFAADADAGGAQCTVRASYGTGTGSTVIGVTHRVSAVTVTPASADVVEGSSVSFSAVDDMGHGLSFNWSTDCGAFAAGTAPNEAVYTAAVGGPSVCTVQATYGSGTGSAVVTVLHDMAGAHIVADRTTAVEGSQVSLQYLDGADHVLEGTWAVLPASCGGLAQVVPGAVVLAIDSGAGGMTCDVQGTVGGMPAVATIVVLHDTAGATISPASALLVEGAQRDFSFVDSHGHPVDVAWTVEPTTCGSVLPASGPGTTLMLSADGGGSTCTVRATLGGFEWTALVTVQHGEGIELSVQASAASAAEGGSVTVDATLADAAGHGVDASNVGWTTECGTVSPNTGPSVTVTIADGAGSTDCDIVATYGSTNASVRVSVSHAAPFSVTVGPATSSMLTGATATFTATVRDAKGHDLTNAVLTWSATCGQLNATAGWSVTFTAPQTAGTCTVQVAATVGATAADGANMSVQVTPPEGPGPTDSGGGGFDMVLIGALIAVVAGAGVGFLVLRRSRGGGKQGDGPQEKRDG